MFFQPTAKKKICKKENLIWQLKNFQNFTHVSHNFFRTFIYLSWKIWLNIWKLMFCVYSGTVQGYAFKSDFSKYNTFFLKSNTGGGKMRRQRQLSKETSMKNCTQTAWEEKEFPFSTTNQFSPKKKIKSESFFIRKGTKKKCSTISNVTNFLSCTKCEKRNS